MSYPPQGCGIVQEDIDESIATHEAMATVHQDAPALIGVHASDAGAHHDRYTDTEAIAAAWQTADEVEVEELDAATYDDMQDFINQLGSRTHITGMVISDGGGGAVNISAGTGWCKVENDLNAVGRFFDFAGKVGQTLTDLLVNYIYLDYNGGAPQIVVDTTGGLFYDYDHLILGCVFRNGTVVHFINSAWPGVDAVHRAKMRLFEERGAHRTSGMATGSAGARRLAITAGIIWVGLSRIAVGPFDTSDGDTFSYWYYDGDLPAPAWVEVTAQTAVSNTQYNALATGLASLGSNRFGVHWVYIDQEGDHLHVIYGQGNYTAALAETAGVPASLPPIATNFGILIAKIICQEGTDVLTITYPWTTAFRSSLATDHGSLAGLGDDDHPQYLTPAEHTAVGDDSPHHARYDDSEAVSAMGEKADDNPLNHDQPDVALYVLKSLFDANTILIAASDDTPEALAIAASRVVGRKSTGGIVALTGAELMAMLTGQAGADFSLNTHKLTGVVDPTADQHAATKKYVDDNLPGALARGRAFLNAPELNFPHGKNAMVTLNDTDYDPQSMFSTGTWQAGVGDAGSNATTVIDADPTTGSGFEAHMLYARVVWDGGASYGFITAVNSATSISIYKTEGTDFTTGDAYTIAKAYFTIPTAGYWLCIGVVTWIWNSVVADKEYLVQFLVNGAYKSRVIKQSAGTKTTVPLTTDVIHLDAGDKISLGCEAYANVDTCDLYGSAGGGQDTFLTLALLEAD